MRTKFTFLMMAILMIASFSINAQDTTVVPVELSHFDVELSEGVVALSFQTASELNNSHFEVERSIDGDNFEVIGIVNGHGTTYEVQDYIFYDHIPESETNYYRLKQVDFDGQYEYSKTVSIDIDKPGPKIISNMVSYEIEFNQTVRGATLFDVNGNRIRQLSSGDSMRIFDLPNGIYILKLNHQTHKILKI